GTIHGASVLNSELSAMKLNAAFLGPIVDTGMIIRVLISHTNKQRQAIKRHYRILYGKLPANSTQRKLAFTSGQRSPMSA
ncbi:unnamed protein product, partial [Timema podura]|nr:unnamed protein product [Timema podura]